MEGIVFDIKRFAVHDGPGIRTTIFLKGCPLSCWWCHNPESICPNPIATEKKVTVNGIEFTDTETIGYKTNTSDLIKELSKEKLFMEESGGGVTFSGGEPLMQHFFLHNLILKCKSESIHTTVDTSLLASWEVVEKIATSADLLLVDLKLMDDTAHKTYCGVSNKLILSNIIKLAALRRPLRIRIPIIPQITDTATNIEACIHFLAPLRNAIEGIDLLPFHNSAKVKYQRIKSDNKCGHLASLHKSDLLEIKSAFEKAGHQVKIGG